MPDRPSLSFNVPPPYPELQPDENGEVGKDDIERAYLEGAHVYGMCMVELESIKKQAEVCINEPR